MTKAQRKMLADIASALHEVEIRPDGVVARGVTNSLYKPPRKLGKLLTKIEAYGRRKSPTKRQREEAGLLLEQVAFVVFSSIAGPKAIKSYRSPGFQLDLFATGHEASWELFTRVARIDPSKRGILVECKATQGRVSDATFARLCSVLHHNFERTGGLGIFFSLVGASGFPAAGEPRQRHLADARMRQVIFHARTALPIVVLDLPDILRLGEIGSLPRILERKIRDIEELSGLPPFEASGAELDLPEHLRAVAGTYRKRSSRPRV